MAHLRLGAPYELLTVLGLGVTGRTLEGSSVWRVGTRKAHAALAGLLLTACSSAPFSTTAAEPALSSPVSSAQVLRPSELTTLPPTPPPTDAPADDPSSAAPTDPPGPARFGLPTVDANSHLLTYLWTFPGGEAVFRPLDAVPTGLIDLQAAEHALANGATTPPEGEAFLATYETNLRPPQQVWAAVWTAEGAAAVPPPPIEGPPAPLPTISIFANVIDAQTGAPLGLHISSR